MLKIKSLFMKSFGIFFGDGQNLKVTEKKENESKEYTE